MFKIYFDISSLNTIRTWFDTVLSLPCTPAEFSIKYGSNIEGCDVDDFISTIKKIHDISERFMLKNSVHIINMPQEKLLQHSDYNGSLTDCWADLANMVLNTAKLFIKALPECEKMPSPSETKEKLLGLTKIASALRVKTIEIRKRTTDERLIVEPLVRHISNHNILNITSQKMGLLKNQIAKMQQKTDHNWWQSKKSKQTIETDIISKQSEIKLYNELLSDAGSVFDDGRISANFIKLDSTAYCLWSLFDNTFNRLNFIITNSSEEQISSSAWLAQALDTKNNIDIWDKVHLSAQQFIEDIQKWQ